MWHNYADPSKTAMSFLNLTQYPASLDFLVLTLSVVFLFFAITAQRPLFIYLFSTFLIHLLAMIILWVSGNDPKAMVITADSYGKASSLSTYGYAIEVI